MLNLIIYFFEFLQFSRSPAELPASRWLLGALIGVLWSLWSFILRHLQVEDAGFRALAAEVLIVGCCGGVFTLLKRPERLLQSLCAIFGAGFILSCFAAVIAWFADGIRSSLGQSLAGFFGFGLVLLLSWFLALVTHILKTALRLPILQCALIALAILGVVLVADQWLQSSGL